MKTVYMTKNTTAYMKTTDVKPANIDGTILYETSLYMIRPDCMRPTCL